MTENPLKIWALFSVDNLYDQSSNNLVAWWGTKPSLNVLSIAITGKPIENLPDETIVGVVRIYAREGKCLSLMNNTAYRLKEIAEGKVS